MPREKPRSLPNPPLDAGDDGKTATEPMVFLLTDDAQVHKQVRDALHGSACGLRVLTKTGDLWAMGFPAAPGCLLCSHPLRKRTTGFNVLEGIRERELPLPVLFLAADWDVDLVVRAMKAGAFDFLTLPLDTGRLRAAVKQAIRQGLPRWQQARAVAAAKARVASLDKREREVIRLVINGFLNKEIAGHLNLALVTIKLYRSRAMKKMGAGNAPEMVRIATLAGMCDEERIPRPN